jgi:DNA-binding MarR family transcriptional regulator
MTVRDTSRKAYDELKATKAVSNQEHAILVWLSNQSSSRTRREIARGLGMETSAVSGRVNTLIKKRLVAETPTRPCPISGKTVHPIIVI